MAKQRPQPKVKAQAPLSDSDRTGRTPVRSEGVSPRTPDPASIPAAPARRSTYAQAVAVYEKGVEAIQRHEYDRALELLKSVLTLYPEEKELHERVRLYLNVCERHATPRAAAPQTLEERLYASTIAING